MPLWFLTDGQSQFVDGTVFLLDCDMCASRFGLCDCDVKSGAPIAELLKEIDSTDWLVLRSDSPAVTVKFICPDCQSLQRRSAINRLPDVTPERPSPMERMRAAGSDLEVGRLRRWGSPMVEGEEL